MAVKKIGRRVAKISPAAVEAFRAGDEDALYHALRLRPWEHPTPLGIADGEVCPHGLGTAAAEWWPRCQELKRALQKEI